MNVLMISIDFPPIVGGIAAHVYELSKALIKQGINVTVATRKINKTQKDYEIIDNIPIYRFELKYIGWLYGIQINNFVTRLHNAKNFDIIHIHGMRPLEFFNINTQVVYTNHTSGYLKRLKKGGYRLYFLKKIFQKPKLFIAPSKELLKIPFEIKAKKIYIPNGVDIEKYKRNEKLRFSIRKKLNLKENDILGIVTRRMVWKNGVEYLAKATKYIKNKNLKLLFIGDGEEYTKIKSLLNLYFKDRFFLLGSLTHDEIIKYYSAADFSILPSIMEATSISGLEAMAASLPLIGTKTGGIPDLIEEGKNGFLCNVQDEIDLANKIDLILKCNLQKMGDYSRNKVEKEFAWDIIAKKTISAYESLL